METISFAGSSDSGDFKVLFEYENGNLMSVIKNLKAFGEKITDDSIAQELLAQGVARGDESVLAFLNEWILGVVEIRDEAKD